MDGCMARAHTCTPPLHTTVLALPAYPRCLPPSSPLSAAYYFFSFHDSFLPLRVFTLQNRYFVNQRTIGRIPVEWALELVEFQSSGHWNWWNSSRVGTGIGGIPVEWAPESYRPMDRPMGRPDGRAYGCGSLWAGSTRQRGAHEYGTVTRRHHASPSPRVVVEFSRREGGPCGPGVSRGRMGTSTRTPTDTLRLAGCPHTQAPTLVQTNVATQTRPRRRPWRWVARCRRRRAWR